MRRIFTAIILAGALLCACSKDWERPSGDKAKAGEMVNFTLKVRGVSVTTKATADPDGEKAANIIDIFACNSLGEIVSHIRQEEQTTFKLSIAQGKYDFLVFVNCAASFDAVKTINDLRSTRLLLSDDSLTDFVMTGYLNLEVTDGCTASISVRRQVSKVVLKQISLEWADASLAQEDFVVESVYLTNVVGSELYTEDEALESHVWYNKMRYEQGSAVEALTYETVSRGIPDKGKLTQDMSFYCFPNLSTELTEAGDWSPRVTRLVIQAKLGDRPVMYYPINLAIDERNNIYTVRDIKITKLGSDHPDKPVKTSETESNIIVEDWEDGGEISEEI